MIGTLIWRTDEPLTLLLAPVIGAYLVLSAVGLLRSPSAAPRFVADVSAHPGVAHALGAVAFLVGAGVVSFHRHWSTGPEVVVSLTGCWWALEGAGLLASPHTALRALDRPEGRRLFRVLNAAAMAMGVYLLAAWAAAELR